MKSQDRAVITMTVTAGLCVLVSYLNVLTKAEKLMLTCISTCSKLYPRGCICLAVT